MYNRTIQEICGVDKNTARYIESFLRLQYSTLDDLSREQIKFEYVNGGATGSIKDAIRISMKSDLEKLAKSFGL